MLPCELVLDWALDGDLATGRDGLDGVIEVPEELLKDTAVRARLNQAPEGSRANFVSYWGSADSSSSTLWIGFPSALLLGLSDLKYHVFAGCDSGGTASDVAFDLVNG